MSELRKIIVNATSEMLDSPDEHGIYPTGKFYNRLEDELQQYIKTLTGIDAGMVVQDHDIKTLIYNLSKQTTITGRLQNAIAAYLEYQTSPSMTINPVNLNLGKELE